jgi:hypothetical protein
MVDQSIPPRDCGKEIPDIFRLVHVLEKNDVVSGGVLERK